MDEVSFFYIGIPILGFILIVFAVALMVVLAVKGRAERGDTLLSVTVENLGTFKGSALTFVIVVGAVLIGAGVFFRYQDYESSITALENNMKELGAKYKITEENLLAFREVRLEYFLQFPLENRPEDIFDTDVIGYVRKKGGGYEVYKSFDYQPEEGNIRVEFQGLTVGDSLFVVAIEKGTRKKWRSTHATVPLGRLKMKVLPATRRRGG